jgi:hypothetical protein
VSVAKKILENLPSPHEFRNQTHTPISDPLEVNLTISTIIPLYNNVPNLNNMLGEEADPQKFETDKNGKLIL